MSTSQSNPPVSSFLRFFTIFEVIVLIVTGGGAFFLPDVIRPIWPWEIRPFNLAFIGAIYLASLVSIAMMAVVGRWAPARVVLWMLLTFTGIALIASLLNLSQFHLQSWATWVWILLYIALPLDSAIHLWLYRNMPPAPAVAIPAGWRYFLLAQSAVLGVYGLGQFFLPGIFSAFWPWTFDAFHSQIYSGTFLSTAVGGLLVARGAARSEILALSFPEIGIALFGIGGLALVDASVHRVDWAAPGTWAWIGMLAVMGGAGLAMLRWWQRARG